MRQTETHRRKHTSTVGRKVQYKVASFGGTYVHSGWNEINQNDNHSYNNLLRARPKAERVLAEYENFLKLSDPTVTLFSVLYLLNQATD